MMPLLTSAFWKKHNAALLPLGNAVFIALAWYAGRENLTNWELFCYLLAYLVGGYRQALEGIQTLLTEKELDVDLLMVLAAIGAASIGYWQDGAILIFIFSLSGALEEYTLEKTKQDLHAIMRLRPETALLIDAEGERLVKVESLLPGNRILIKPGERIAADGVIQEGHSAVNQASITGESIPVDKQINDEVFAGTINGQGSLLVEVTTQAESTLLAKIIRLVQEAQTEKPPSQLFIERFERTYVKGVLGIAMLLLLLPPYFWNLPWDQTVYQAMLFLVVASPCALVASIMPAMLAGISNGARKGVLFKGGIHLENIGEVKVVAFDKTGTLTAGKPQVTDIIPLAALDESALLALAASLEARSEHPLAKAILAKAKEWQVILSPITNFQAVPGLGVQGLVNETDLTMGALDSKQIKTLSHQQKQKVQQLEAQGKTVIYIKFGQELQGIMALQDTLRPEAYEAVQSLKQLGLKTVMLTGDNQLAAQTIGSEVGVDHIYAALLPAEKVNIIRDLTSKYGKVAMVGDGINDAPALATAAVGIAMGAAGSDVALETASVVLMADDLSKIAYSIKLGRRARRIIKQNLAFASAVVLCLVAGTFFQNVTLPSGVIGHEGSTLLVIVSGLRLLREEQTS